MNKLSLALGLAALAALLAAGLALRKAATYREENRALRTAAVSAPAPVRETPVEAPVPVAEPVAGPGAVREMQRVDIPVAVPPSAPEPPPLPEHVRRDLENYDRAMDREFDRLDGRAAAPADAAEQDLVARLKEQLLKLDELRTRAETVAPEERERLRAEMQQVMGSIISLGAAHRRQRLEVLARRVGYKSEQEIAAFLDEVDRIYRETELDWASLFTRGP